MTITRLLRRLLKSFAVFAVLVVLGGVALVAFASLERRTEVTLPTPTGSFAVGRAIQDWTDDTAVDALAPTPGTKRELLVWIWYPAAGRQSLMTDDYLPARLRLKPKDAGGGNIWTLLTRDASKVRGHSAPDPGVSPQERAYPVVIMRAGGSAGVLNYSTLAEDLASHGYIVVGFDAPYRTGLVVFPDGRVMRRTAQNNPERCVVPDRAEMEGCVTPVIAAWTGDMAFVLERGAVLP
jgi:hypothetical protein